MLHFMKNAAIAVIMFIVAAAPVRAADTVTADDVARFLAGMPLPAQSQLAPLTKDPWWQRHARFFDAAFGQLEERQLSKIRVWAAANLAAPRSTMFYMFSGPDFLYADAFYSKATTYVLSALEPVGSIPDLSRLSSDGIYYTLYDVEHSMSSILNFSFFITKHMKTDLHAGELSGTLPILYVLLVRSGKTIRDVSPITLDNQGAEHPANDSDGRSATRGIRIRFAGSDGVEKTLYYFSTDLSNNSLRSSGFLKFCAALAPGNSLIKSASYLLHTRSFTTVRDFLLANSATIIQDDSGIPLGDYDPGKWRFFPFGHYAGPIAKFPRMYQPKYAELFQRSQPIDFGIGYRWRSFETNLLLSVKVASDAPGSADAAPAAELPQPKPPPPKRPRPQPRSFWPFDR
jgi:hypothetical protein